MLMFSREGYCLAPSLSLPNGSLSNLSSKNIDPFKLVLIEQEYLRETPVFGFDIEGKLDTR